MTIEKTHPTFEYLEFVKLVAIIFKAGRGWFDGLTQGLLPASNLEIDMFSSDFIIASIKDEKYHMDPLKFDKILGLNKDELDQVARSKPG